MSLAQFAPSRLNSAYRLSKNRQFHFAERFAIAVIEYACYSVFRKVGSVPWSMIIMDCSASSGDTPAGRHPRGSHDAGVNLDLGYYGLVPPRQGRPFVPGPHNGRRMTGPVDPRLLARQAELEWFLAVGRLEVDIGGVLVRLCATDPYIERYLDPYIEAADERPATIMEALRICYSSGRGGWEIFHHHHRHIRFNRMANGDDLAAYIERAWTAPLLDPAPSARLSVAAAEVVEDEEALDVPDYPMDDWETAEDLSS